MTQNSFNHAHSRGGMRSPQKCFMTMRFWWLGLIWHINSSTPEHSAWLMMQHYSLIGQQKVISFFFIWMQHFPTICWTSAVRHVSLFSPQSKDWQSNQVALQFTRPSTWLSEQVERGTETGNVVHPFHSAFTLLHIRNHASTHFPASIILKHPLWSRTSVLQVWGTKVIDGAAETKFWDSCVIERENMPTMCLIVFVCWCVFVYSECFSPWDSNLFVKSIWGIIT